MVALYLLLALSSIARAAPNINLPVNAQVPPVARPNQPFNFSFSESTFTSSTGSIIYAIANGPAWLQLDGGSRTFSGTPAAGDAGSLVVNLVAMDNTGSTTMPVTLVVSTDSGPGLGVPVTDQLSTHSAFSGPDSLLLPHDSALSLAFSSNTFTNTDSKTVYYALCANNTPLPSWIHFDSNSLSFSGMTPQATSQDELSQAVAIRLTASDVIGFAGAASMFQIIVQSHVFAFSSSVQILNITSGSPLSFSGLQADLNLDGQQVSPSDLTKVVAAAPPWLSLDAKTLVLSGTPPPEAVQENFTVTATDIYGDTASTVVILLRASATSSNALIRPIGALNATIGSDFVYDLNKTLTNPNTALTVDLRTASPWLTFNPDTSELRGHVPSDLKPQQIVINITATQGSQSSSQLSTINVVDPSGKAGGSSTVNAQPSARSGPGSNDQAGASVSGAWASRHKGVIAGTVVAALVVALVALILCCCLLKRRARRAKRTYSFTSSEPGISGPGPVVIEKTQTITEEPAEIEMSGALDAEKKRASSRISRAPMIDIPLLWKSGTNKRDSKSRLSRLTMDERNQAKRPDSWQKYITDLNSMRPRSTAVSTFGPISEQAKSGKRGPVARVVKAPRSHVSRVSARSHTSRPSAGTANFPTKRYSRYGNRRSNFSLGSSGVLSSPRMSGFGHGRNAPSQTSSYFFGAKGVGHGDGGGPPGYGSIRDSWRNFGRLSLVASTNSSGQGVAGAQCFPDAPDQTATSSTLERLGLSQSIVETEGRLRETIRLVSSSSRKDGAWKRLSRAPTVDRPPSTQIKGPEALSTFHKNRLRQRNSPNPLFAAGPSSSRHSSHTNALPPSQSKKSLRARMSPLRQSNGNILVEPSSPKHDSLQRTYSQSSSLEPPSRPSPSRTTSSPRRKFGRRSLTSPRVSATLLYHFSRIESKPSIMTDDSDSRWESANSDAQSMDPYTFAEESFVEDNESGLPAWRHPEFPDPIRPNRFNESDNRAERLAEELAAGRGGSILQRLSQIRAQTDGNSSLDDDDAGMDGGKGFKVRSTRGKKLGQSLGLQQGTPANTSFRGDIRDVGESSFL